MSTPKRLTPVPIPIFLRNKLLLQRVVSVAPKSDVLQTPTRRDDFNEKTVEERSNDRTFERLLEIRVKFFLSNAD